MKRCLKKQRAADNDGRGDGMLKTRIMHIRLTNICVICKERKQDGIQIAHAFFCTNCEEDIVKLDVKTRMYDHYVNKVKTASFFLMIKNNLS